MSKILWITPKSPLPANDGARRATVSLLSELSKSGHRISLLVVDSEDSFPSESSAKELGVESLYKVRRTAGIKARLQALIYPWLPITVAPYAARAVRREIDCIIRSQAWDILLYDGAHAAAHASRFGRFNAESNLIVYRAHNCESELWQRRASLSTLPFSLFIKFQAWLMRRFENSLVSSARATLAVSDRDAGLLNGERSYVVPIGIDFASCPRDLSRSRSGILFIGRLDWSPNREGLKWFLKEVWPQVKLRRPEFVLTIAGSGDSSWLNRFLGDSRISFLGEVSDTAALFDQALLSIAPLWNGSGTRVKIIEASSRGCATLSTTIGFEGLALKDRKSIFVANSGAEWIELLSNLSVQHCQDVGQQAWQEMRMIYDSERCAKICSELLCKVAGEGKDSAQSEFALKLTEGRAAI